MMNANDQELPALADLLETSCYAEVARKCGVPRARIGVFVTAPCRTKR